MLDMFKYNMASQHDSTTQVFYSIGSEESDITNMGLMTQHSEHTSQSTSGSVRVKTGGSRVGGPELCV